MLKAFHHAWLGAWLGFAVELFMIAFVWPFNSLRQCMSGNSTKDVVYGLQRLVELAGNVERIDDRANRLMIDPND